MKVRKRTKAKTAITILVNSSSNFNLDSTSSELEDEVVGNNEPVVDPIGISRNEHFGEDFGKNVDKIFLKNYECSLLF